MEKVEILKVHAVSYILLYKFTGLPRECVRARARVLIHRSANTVTNKSMMQSYQEYHLCV